tara:strand:- start:368 stop:562 length:195 start_codon:yes stop_codon:yes gene_type:complete
MKITQSHLRRIIKEELASRKGPAQALADQMEGTLHALEDGYLVSIDELIPIFRDYIKRARELST